MITFVTASNANSALNLSVKVQGRRNEFTAF
jgi:hypothetical protein